MVLIEGEYTVEETIRVLAMGHPPSEKRDTARYVNVSNYALAQHAGRTEAELVERYMGM
jgi:hypothetical protein